VQNDVLIQKQASQASQDELQSDEIYSISSREIREIYKDFECRNVYCDEINHNEIHDVHVK
jgi:hypothetical protein